MTIIINSLDQLERLIGGMEKCLKEKKPVDLAALAQAAVDDTDEQPDNELVRDGGQFGMGA